MSAVLSQVTMTAGTRPQLLDASSHVCAFFESEDEEYEVLLPFIKARGEGMLHAIGT